MRKLLLLVSLLPLFGAAQKLFPPAANGEALSRWAQLMYSQNPNVYEVDREVKAYYRTHPFEKNSHTQYYKKWRRAVRDHITEEGYIHWPTPSETAMEEARYRQQRGNVTAQALPPVIWSCIGPYETAWDQSVGAPASWQVNVYSLDQSLSNPDVLYAGTETAEIFKTTDHGLTWLPVSRNYALPSVTAMRIHPANPDTAFAGGGDYIYKTADGGLTWTAVLTVASLNPYDIVIHPTNPRIVMAGTSKGLYRSTDGGANWTNLFTNKSWDLEFKPGAPNTVYLVRDNASAIICEFYKSTDAGATWSIRSTGWYTSSDPNRSDGGARIAVSPADPTRVYAYLIGESKAGDNGFIGIWKSTDSGDNWSLPHTQVGGPYTCTNANSSATCTYPNLATIGPTGTYHQGFYNMDLVCSSTDPNKLLIGGCSLWRSDDGGATYYGVGGYSGPISRIHPDIQDLVVNGNDTWVASDGGINYSTDFMLTHTSRKYGITGSDFWGFGTGWNQDVIVGGRYHNGNTAWSENWGGNSHLRLGGGEASTGYINPGNAFKAYFSDLGGRYIPGTINDPITNFPVGKFPNESYYAAHSSEMEFDPRCYGIIYLGNEHKLFKSTDAGVSFALVDSFGTDPNNDVTAIEIARSNPDVMYLVQHNFTTAACTLWKSTDAGTTWNFLPKPPGYSRVATIAVSPVNENIVWVAWVQGGNGQKIYKSTDGGQTWNNLTTALLDNSSIYSMLPQGGTADGIYIGTNKTVWYRNNSHTDWQLYASGLPFVIETNILRPFYRDGKIRMGSYGKGVWEAPLFETSPPVAQPMVDRMQSSCLRDTLYFDDYSMLNHSNAQWSWSFSGPAAPAYISSTTVRNPKVVFAQTGSYSVTLTVTDGSGNTSTKTVTNMVTVSNDCAADTVPGLALSLDGNNDYAAAPALNLNSNTVTISAWVKPNGTQNDWAAVVFCRGGNTTAGMSIKSNNEFRYHWAGGGWSWSSGIYVTPDEWNHVAMVAEPTKMTLYVNGIPAVNNTALAAEEFDAMLQIGLDNNSSARCLNGLIDEVAIYNRSLSQNEIRELQHLTRDPLADPSLVAYYQFNELSGQVLDRAGVKHASLSGNATRAISTGPFAKGTSYRTTVSAGGTVNFSGTQLSIGFGSNPVPNGEVVCSRLHVRPDQLPACADWSSSHYWILNNYGANASFGPVSFMMYDSLAVSGNIPPNSYAMWERPFYEDGNTWGSPLSYSTASIPGQNGTIEYGANPGLTYMGQLVLTSNAHSATAQICNGDSMLLGGAWQYSAGTYSDSLHSMSGCDSVVVTTLSVLNAQVPVITQSGSTLNASGAGNCQWYLNGNLINGATNCSYSPVQNGSYTVVQTDSNGCSATSAPFSFITGLGDEMSKFFRVYPNPLAKGSGLVVECDIAAEANFRLLDAGGKLLYETRIRTKAEVQLPVLAAGVYFYEWSAAGAKGRGKLVVE